MGGRKECLANTACARSRGFVPSWTDISWGAVGTPPALCMAPQSCTVQSKTITVAFRAATCNQKTHSWIFPEVRQALKGEKNNMAGKLPEEHYKRDSAQQGGRRDGGRRIPHSGICPVPTTQDPCGSLAQKATSNKALELAAFSQPKNEPKSFGTPLVQPFLGGLGHS